MKPPIRLLTLPQPFASALISGQRLTHCVDLHALSMVRQELERLQGETFVLRASDVNWNALPKARKHLSLPPASDLPERALLGIVVFDRLARESDTPWWKPGLHALVFRDPVALPVPLPQGEQHTRHWGTLLLHLRRDLETAVARALEGKA